MVSTLTLPQIYGNPTDAEMAAFEDKAFQAWLDKIDAALGTYELSIGDLPDVELRNIYDDGGSVGEAVRTLLNVDW